MTPSKLLKLFNITVTCVFTVFIVVSLAAFKYSEAQMNYAIHNHLSLKTGQNIENLSVKTIIAKEQHDVRVEVFQYNGIDGVETGTAVFSKLPLIPQYRYERMYLGYDSKEFAAVIDTGLTQELTLVNGKDITMSTAGIGTVSFWLILFVGFFLEQLIIRKIHAISMKGKQLPEHKPDE